MSYSVPRTSVSPCVYRMLFFSATILVSSEAFVKKVPRKLEGHHVLSDKLASIESHASKSGNYIQQQAKTEGTVGKNQSAVEFVLPNVSQALIPQLQNFQSEVAAMQSMDGAAIRKQIAEYDRQLEAQRSEIANAEALNARKTSETEELRKMNEGLRRKASMLTEASHKVRSVITQLQNNITMAMEFMQQSLNASETLLNGHEMQVMKDLDKQDMMMQKRLADMKHLNLIGMLQISSLGKRSKHVDVTITNQNLETTNSMHTKFVQGMLVTLDEYAKQKEVTEDNLEKAFTARLQAGSKQLQALHDEYGDLSKTCEEEKELQKKLIVAVQHLEKTYGQLSQQKLVLFKFFQSLGHRHALA